MTQSSSACGVFAVTNSHTFRTHCRTWHSCLSAPITRAHASFLPLQLILWLSWVSEVLWVSVSYCGTSVPTQLVEDLFLIIVALAKIKKAAYTKIPNGIFTCFIGFQKIWALPPKPSFYEFPILKYWPNQIQLERGRGHFEMYFLNDEARVGNSGSFDHLFSMIIWACKKIQLVVIFSGSKPNTPVLSYLPTTTTLSVMCTPPSEHGVLF